MRILYLITGLRLGGAETQLLLLSSRLIEAGHQIIVVSMESKGTMAGQFTERGVKVTELGINGAFSAVPGYQKFKSIVAQFSPDVIHSHMIHSNLFACIYKLFNKHCKLICTAHNINEGGAVFMYGYRLTRNLPNWSTNVSLEAYNRYVKQGYFDDQRSSFVPNAIDTQHFHPSSGNNKVQIKDELKVGTPDFIFLAAGRLEKQKNFQMLITTFSTFKMHVKNTKLLIAGEGSLKDDLIALTNRLQLQNDVIFLGRRNDMVNLFQAANCFVLCSKHEGFGLVIAEAMAVKIPVIATDCGGINEVMGGFGKLIKVNDVNALAQAMMDIYHHPPLEEHLANARTHIERHYSVDIVLKKWIALYQG